MSKFKHMYNPETRHFISNVGKYGQKQAAQIATEQGYRLDVCELADIYKGHAAYRFDGKKGNGYKEVEEGATGSFAVWVMPVLGE